MTKHTKQAIIISVIILLVLCAGATVFAFRTDIQCLWWYMQCRTWEKDNRVYKIEAVGKLYRAKAVRILCWMLEDDDEGIRWLATNALGKLGDKRAVTPLIAALKDTDSDVRCIAAHALGYLGDQPSPELSPSRSASAEQGRLACKRAVEPLIVALKDTDSSVRRWAANALGKLGDRRAIESLIVALKDTNPAVRESGAWALAKIGDKDALKPLKKALAVEKNEFVYVEIQAAINKLESLPDPTSPRLRSTGESKP